MPSTTNVLGVILTLCALSFVLPIAYALVYMVGMVFAVFKQALQDWGRH